MEQYTEATMAKVQVTGRAHKALLRLSGTTPATYEATKDALKARFDPESRHTRYQAEFQARRDGPTLQTT